MGSVQSNAVAPSNISIPGHFIIQKKIDGELKEQFAYVTHFRDMFYHYRYGLSGYHEGKCRINELRPLTAKELGIQLDGHTTQLPQEFYESLDV